MRLMPIPGYEELMSLRISGTADVIQVELDELVLNCQTYACGHPATFKIKAKFAAKKYDKFIFLIKTLKQLKIDSVYTDSIQLNISILQRSTYIMYRTPAILILNFLRVSDFFYTPLIADSECVSVCWIQLNESVCFW